MFILKKRKIDLYCNFVLLGCGSLHGNLYKVDLHVDLHIVSPSVIVIVGSKLSRTDDMSSMLWLKCLGHIYRQKMERLVKDGVDCLKGKIP